MDPTPETLIHLAGLTGDTPGLPADARLRVLNAQLHIIQSMPEPEQDAIFSELAAKHLPALLEKFRLETGPANGPMVLMNSVSHTPYFVRFMFLPVAAGLAALQAKRIAANVDEIRDMEPESGVDNEDKAILLPSFELWQNVSIGQFAAETSRRCLAQLSNTHILQDQMRSMFMRPLRECGGPTCGAPRKSDGNANRLSIVRKSIKDKHGVPIHPPASKLHFEPSAPPYLSLLKDIYYVEDRLS